jgi:hypothetical protein
MHRYISSLIDLKLLKFVMSRMMEVNILLLKVQRKRLHVVPHNSYDIHSQKKRYSCSYFIANNIKSISHIKFLLVLMQIQDRTTCYHSSTYDNR